MQHDPTLRAGTIVRVRVTGRRVAPWKRTVDGWLGRVVHFTASAVVVDFPGLRFRARFSSADLEQIKE